MHTIVYIVCLLSAIAAASPFAERASPYWYETIKHGAAFRSVKDYGAKGDGTTDDTAAINKAITDSRTGSSSQGVVYFPHGVYVVSKLVTNPVNTVLMGDPTNRPTIKASSSFSGNTLLSAAGGGLGGFFYAVKNLVLDSTAVAPTKAISLAVMGGSQATQLTNVKIVMPEGNNAHTGIVTSGAVMPLLVNDIEVYGGGIGYSAVALQIHAKNLYFKNVATAIKVGDTLNTATLQGMRFDNCNTGIDATSSGVGVLSVLDSTATNTPLFLTIASTTNTQNSLVMENIIVDSTVKSTVKIGTTVALTGSIVPGNTWIRGNVYTGQLAASTASTVPGTMFNTSRPAALVNNTGFFHTAAPPTYAEFDASQVVNVKKVAGSPVAGDGLTDDTANLQAILNDSKGKVVYFPYGTYVLTDSLVIPPGSRLFGEAWSRFTPKGSKFMDAKNPKAMIKIGNPGDVGVAQMSDFLFTAGANLPGATLLEVHMAGEKPGDVGFFNTHFWISAGTIRTCAHFKPTASVYLENSWATSQSGGGSNPGAAAGFLVEAQNGTWIMGMGSEHHFLYQVGLWHAKNVFLGLHAGETPYWQGQGNTLLPPAPFANLQVPSDPDFTWCTASDAKCRMAIYQYVVNSTNVNFYSNAFWNFRNGPSQGLCTGDCQTNAVLFENNSKFFEYGVGSINQVNLVMETGPGANKRVIAVKRNDNYGSPLAGFPQDKSALVAAYLRQSQ